MKQAMIASSRNKRTPTEDLTAPERLERSVWLIQRSGSRSHAGMHEFAAIARQSAMLVDTR
jgi:hypothetical protein